MFYRVKKFLPWIHHHTNKAKIYKVQDLQSVQQVTKINGQQMGIAGCDGLRFRVHPYCKRQAGSLLRSSRKDKEALKKCKEENRMNPNPARGKKKTKKNKSKKIKKSKSKKKRSKLKKRKRTKLKIVY